MAKLFVPACGDRIILKSQWVTDLYLEYRNIEFAETFGFYNLHGKTQRWNLYNKKIQIVLPEHTELECDRVYIRTTSKSAKSKDDDYDSITWKIIQDGKAKRKSRFWVKLADCYNIDFDDNNIIRYKDRV